MTAAIRWRAKKSEKKIQAAPMFDLRAAYDVLDKSIFLEKAAAVGITGAVLSWLESYLSDRTQLVQVNGEQSSALLFIYT